MADSSVSIRQDVPDAAAICETLLMDGYPPGRWGDEVGCVDDGPHECPKLGEHSWHRCRRCGAVAVDDEVTP